MLKVINFLIDNKNDFLKLFLIFLLIHLFIQSMGNPMFVIHELNYLMQPYDLRGIAKGTLYILAYISSIIGVLLFMFVKSNRLFYIFIIIIFIFYFTDFFTQLLGFTNGFSHDRFSLAINEAGNIAFLVSYLYEILYAGLISLFLVGMIVFLRKKYDTFRYPSIASVILIIPILSIYIVVKNVSSIKSSSFPALFKAPAIMLYYYEYKEEAKERILKKDVQIVNTPKIKNIIWIIDESIAGSYLSINGYKQKTTPFLDTLLASSKDAVNYGIVNSISNCSLQSNYYLRIGLNPMVHTKAKTLVNNLPTIYQYAKRAGYKTWLIDSQASKDTLQNNLSIYDAKYIDNFITYDRDILPSERDGHGLEEIIKIQKDTGEEKNFIVMVKFGAHFPYLLSYDRKNTIFQPAMETTYGGFTSENKEKLINTYLNSIYNNTDVYLENLISKSDLNNSIIFYTSDHGQNIMESDGKTTHCNSQNIVKNEITVPLLVFHKNAKIAYPVYKDKHYSQIQIFPTTLSLLGYDDNISNKYGNSLVDGIDKTKKRLFYILSVDKVGVYDN